ncbi:protein spinster homolog 3 [Tiliqua scincoides]|uniref:protein spinster homolog 3 n=1 Tax=Tiliqua scincoides TaxID=71010 RepID=UPI0034634224
MSEARVSAGLPPPSPLPLKTFGTVDSDQDQQGSGKISAARSYGAVAVLCYINLVNYMDWFTVAGVLQDIQVYFQLGDKTAGLLHTVFILCFLLSAPVFGYIGDRYNRKIILSAGMVLWSGVTLGSSYIPKSMAWLFFISRGLVGIGTASYSTVTPTIIADLFQKDRRTWVLSVFYIFIPVGSGLGYILSAGMAEATGYWGFGFRVTPGMGLVGLVLLIFLVPISARNAAQKHAGKTQAEEGDTSSTWIQDISILARNRSFIWSSLGVTAMTFVTGALGFWMPLFLDRAEVILGRVPPCQKDQCNTLNSRIFGGVTIATGILGVILGAEAARRYKKINARADPLICAVGLLTSAPCMYLAVMLAQDSILAAYILIAFGEFLLSLNWAIVTDILLHVVKPQRQSTAVSLQLFGAHLLGDAGSPFLIGIISDTIKSHKTSSHFWSFRSLQYSFVVCVVVTILGGGCFLITAFYIEEDGKEAAPPPAQGIENKSYVCDEEQRQGELPVSPFATEAQKA